MIEVIEKGKRGGPLLVCVHGLMGHTHDFEPFVDSWGEHFHILIPDYAPKPMECAYHELIDGKEWFLYDLGAKKIAQYMRAKWPGRKAYFAGISVGGKISIEVASLYPDIFAGAVITDVGIGHLSKSELCTYLEATLPKVNMKQAWSQLRVELKDKFPDRMLRILIQSHVEYPDKSIPEARWRQQGYKFYELLKKSRMEDQWEISKNIEAPIFILKASYMSAIAEEDVKRMEENSHIHFLPIPNSGHFIQITHAEDFRRLVLSSLLGLEEKKS